MLSYFTVAVLFTLPFAVSFGNRKAVERKPVPSLALKDMTGNTFTLEEERGKVVLLDFWATWCGPCRTETPWLIELSEKYKDRGLVVLGVSMDDSWSPVKPYVSKAGISYPILLGNDSLTAAFGKLNALPVAYFLDRQLRVADTHTGAGNKKQFEQIIQNLLSE
jgi:cytochrome c biogenesis protein CcmG/thiol:disulfide interchange protein DsbE